MSFSVSVSAKKSHIHESYRSPSICMWSMPVTQPWTTYKWLASLIPSPCPWSVSVENYHMKPPGVHPLVNVCGAMNNKWTPLDFIRDLSWTQTRTMDMDHWQMDGRPYIQRSGYQSNRRWVECIEHKLQELLIHRLVIYLFNWLLYSLVNSDGHLRWSGLNIRYEKVDMQQAGAWTSNLLIFSDTPKPLKHGQPLQKD